MDERQQSIHEKGFNISGATNYGKIKVGTKTIDDAVLNLGAIQKINKNLGRKEIVLKALHERNIPLLREISNYFYRTSGIYSSLCTYLAKLFRYDWYIVPEILDDKVKEEKVLTEFNKILDYLDNSHIKHMCGEIALGVIRDGAYYAYVCEGKNGIYLQELPVNYCRSIYKIGTTPVVEFNMRFFDDKFKDVQHRLKILKLFPKDIQEGYIKYKQGKLPADWNEWEINTDWLNKRNFYPTNATSGWYALEPGMAVKFNLFNDDVPWLANAIPSIIDLDAAQDLDRRKQMQQLLKIVVQKLPLDKNFDLVFDVDEARDIHNNAVDMVSDIIGLDVLTTFADVQVETLTDNNSNDEDALERVERTVYNNAAIASNLFNTDGNLALEKSVLVDEALMRDLIFQFHIFFDNITQKKSNGKKKFIFKFYMLETTIFNYKDMAKMYKEQVQIGYSKMLPQIAMGHTQSSIIHTAHFENEILHLSELMIPPLQSSTMNAEGMQALTGKGTNQQSSGSNSQNPTGETKEAGRPEKPNDEKSEKTIANRESMN